MISLRQPVSVNESELDDDSDLSPLSRAYGVLTVARAYHGPYGEHRIVITCETCYTCRTKLFSFHEPSLSSVFIAPDTFDTWITMCSPTLFEEGLANPAQLNTPPTKLHHQVQTSESWPHNLCTVL